MKNKCEELADKVGHHLSRKCGKKANNFDSCEEEGSKCQCNTSASNAEPVVDLVIVIDTSGSMKDQGGQYIQGC